MKPGSVIKLLRFAEGISQTELAGRLSVTRSYLSQVENDRKQPSLSLLKRASDCLGVPLVLLVAGEESGEAELFKRLQEILAELVAAKLGERRRRVARGGEH